MNVPLRKSGAWTSAGPVASLSWNNRTNTAGRPIRISSGDKSIWPKAAGTMHLEHFKLLMNWPIGMIYRYSGCARRCIWHG